MENFRAVRWFNKPKLTDHEYNFFPTAVDVLVKYCKSRIETA